MARPATGQVVCDDRRKSPVFALRFRAYGKRQYVTLGTTADGWTLDRAETELQNVLADVRRGIWQPPDRQPIPTPDRPADPTFHQFASDWFQANQDAWRPNTRVDYGWQLTNHLLPFFKDHRLSQITIAEVDRYRAAKLREATRLARALADWQRRLDAETDRRARRQLRRDRPPKPLAAVSINKTITRLAQILEVAVEYELLERNPAKGKRRRVKAAKAAPVWLDRAEHITALLDAAGELDRDAREDRQHVYRRAILSVLVLAGLRIGELCDLCWRDVDLTAGKITIRGRLIDSSPSQRMRGLALVYALGGAAYCVSAGISTGGLALVVVAILAWRGDRFVAVVVTLLFAWVVVHALVGKFEVLPAVVVALALVGARRTSWRHGAVALAAAGASGRPFAVQRHGPVPRTEQSRAQMGTVSVDADGQFRVEAAPLPAWTATYTDLNQLLSAGWRPPDCAAEEPEGSYTAGKVQPEAR
jgi:Phage integrase, N-terminal SAM-like domain